MTPQALNLIIISLRERNSRHEAEEVVRYESRDAQHESVADVYSFPSESE